MTPTIGRTVHFVKLNGFHAPAVITSVYAGEAVNLSVFMDKTIDTDNQGQRIPAFAELHEISQKELDLQYQRFIACLTINQIDHELKSATLSDEEE